MAGAVKNTQKRGSRAATARRWLTAACEPLEYRRLLTGYGPLVSVASFVPFPNGENPQAAVTFDASGNLWGTTSQGGTNGDGTIFEIARGSSTITTVASFNGSDGANPECAVTFDASGNLWGTASLGGPNDDGTVFEVVNGSSTITTVASFNGSNGANPVAGVTSDSSGNVWGTTSYSGANGDGTVFEIVKGSSTITTVGNFNGQKGDEPVDPVTFDASGNVWGTTEYGGAYGTPLGDGTVFEIAKGSSTITTVASFNESDGANPQCAVTFDASGNLWGTTFTGGPTGFGTVFEIAKGSSTITTVAGFQQSIGTSSKAAVAFDANGNLWGTNYYGGIFEIAKGSSTITSVASFNGSNGLYSKGAVTFDVSGNLWGTTVQGGADNDGTVFEIAKGSATITTVVSFKESSGQSPGASVTFDSSGNLWGTTYSGGDSNDGTVFEIVNGSSTVTTVASFNGTNGANPQAAVTFDTSGNLWGTTYNGGAGSMGAVFEIVKGSSTITTVASFNGSNGEHPEAAVTFDAGGNLWGTTTGGGPSQYGTIFEITKGSSTITTPAASTGTSTAAVTFDTSGNLWGTTEYGGAYGGIPGDGTLFEVANGSNTATTVASFDYTDGRNPAAALALDPSGNLWGTTTGGGTSGDGTLFEVAKGSSTITTIVNFNGTNGENPDAAVTFDADGNLWGTTRNGGLYDEGTVFEIANGSSTVITVANLNGTNGIESPQSALTFDASGNLWGTTEYGGTADAGTVWEVLPWLSDPAGNDAWNTASHILTVNDPSTIIGDPGSDQPIIEANGPSAVVTINPSGALQIHLGGLSLTNGASAVVTSLGAARTATNHRVLVLGQPGATSAPLFDVDAKSKLDLTDNDLVDHDGSLASVSGLLASGFTGDWTGDGIVSSKAAGSAIFTLGVGQPASAGTFDGETVGTSDVEVRYTYYGDANLDGQVDASDYSKIDFGFLNHLSGWSNGDFNYDGVINGSDYTLIDNAFNTQGASLSAEVAASALQLSSSAAILSGSKSTSSSKTVNRIVKQMVQNVASFMPANTFQTATQITLADSAGSEIEALLQRKDMLDELVFS